jgi:hypothetical protein
MNSLDAGRSAKREVELNSGHYAGVMDEKYNKDKKKRIYIILGRSCKARIRSPYRCREQSFLDRCLGV